MEIDHLGLTEPRLVEEERKSARQDVERNRAALHARTQDGWLEFQDMLTVARDGIRCSYSEVWLRGLPGDYALVPKLYRKFYAREGRLPMREKAWRVHQTIVGLSSLRDQLVDERRRVSELAHSTPASKEMLVGLAGQFRGALKAVAGELRRLESQRDGSDPQFVLTERLLFEEYRVQAGSMGKQSWETLAEMQHYGVPTRLLDWTTAPDIALFFALEGFRRMFFAASCESLDDLLVEVLARYRVTARCMAHAPHSDPVEALRELEHSLSDPRFRGVFGDRSVPILWLFNPYEGRRAETHHRRELGEGVKHGDSGRLLCLRRNCE